MNNDDNTVSEYDKDVDFDDDSEDVDDNDADDDFMDNITLASLKHEKKIDISQPNKAEKRRYRKKNSTFVDSAEVKKMLQKSNLKIRDFVKLVLMVFYYLLKYISKNFVKACN
jgi:hypothetical protein